MRVLMSAYACAAGEGSEPGVGWAWATAAAEVAEVVLLTRSNNLEGLASAIAADKRDLSVTLVGVEGNELLRRHKGRLPFGVHPYYRLPPGRLGGAGAKLLAFAIKARLADWRSGRVPVTVTNFCVHSSCSPESHGPKC